MTDERTTCDICGRLTAEVYGMLLSEEQYQEVYGEPSVDGATDGEVCKECLMDDSVEGSR
jgi:hypothetical protein